MWLEKVRAMWPGLEFSLVSWSDESDFYLETTNAGVVRELEGKKFLGWLKENKPEIWAERQER